MKYHLKARYVLIFVILVVITSIAQAQLPDREEVLQTMIKVNDYWINGHIDPGDWEWNRAAYFTGNMALYHTWPDQKYLYYAIIWAENNGWGLKGGPSTRHADNQCIGQTYLDLYNIEPDPGQIQDIQESVGNMVNSSKRDDWHWIDAFFMAMPVFTRLGILNEDDRYFEKMYDLYEDTKVRRGLFNEESGLWYRDENFDPPFQTPNGKDCHWSRGNGWVLGAHARVLQHLPEEDPHRAEYISTFQKMAAALKEVQRTDGFWNVSLVDPNDFGGPETSGTSFFTYGIAWGINNDFLDSATYYSVVEKAWNGLVNIAVHDDGKLGYVQQVGKEPSSSQPVTYETTADFGVGAFLLAGSEVYKLVGGAPVSPPEAGVNLALNRLFDFSDQEKQHEAVQAVDGSALTKWTAGTFPQWIEIDLEDVYNIYRTEIIPYQNRAYQYIISGKVSTEDDYTLIVDQLENSSGGVVLTDTFEYFPARYVKLTVSGCHDYEGDWASIIEFRVFGDRPSLEVTSLYKDPSIHLFPNPSLGTIYLETKNLSGKELEIQVWNVKGQIVFGKIFANETGNADLTREINVSGLEPGIYVIKIFDGNHIETEKLILK
ncbi:MAG: glycoside hydrolase family 88 protein [Bacteroidales bacterium]